MKKGLFLIFFTAVFTVLLFAGGDREDSSSDSSGNNRIKIFVSILPQKYFASEIGGDRVDVGVMVPPGKSPATYEPTPRQMIALGEASGFFSIGVAFENGFLSTVRDNLPSLKIVDTIANIERRAIEAHDHEDDDHDGYEEPEEEHHEAEPDPHVWMDPLLAKVMGEEIRDGLIELDPHGADYYRANYTKFAGEMDALNQELSGILDEIKGQTLFVYHPAFGYFADRYGLEQEAIETGGKEPTAAQLEEVISKAVEEGVKVIFVQPEFPESSARAVAEAIGGAVVPVAPLKEEYADNLLEIARAVSGRLSE